MKPKTASTFSWELVRSSLAEAFLKLNPCSLWQNPVLLVTELGAGLCTAVVLQNGWKGAFSAFELQVTLWLWITVLFANFAEALAEGRGKAQAECLKKTRTTTLARRLRNGREERIAAPSLRRHDVVVCEAGEMIPADGEVIEGIASVDESAITGESAPVIRESGGDRSAVTGGTRVISDRIVVRITSEPGTTFLDRMISMVEGAKRQRTPNEVALSILLTGLTVLFLIAVATLPAFGRYSEQQAGQTGAANLSVPVLVALFVCLIPTTIGGLLSAIGISGIDRLLRHNVLATSGQAVEAAGDIDVLLLDKTGTVTLGNRQATAFIPVSGVLADRLAEAAQLASLADETPEGRSIVVLAKDQFRLRGREMSQTHARFIPFTAHTRMSGVDFPGQDGVAERRIRKGSLEAMKAFVEQQGGVLPKDAAQAVEDVSRHGGTPLVVAENHHVLGVVQLKDVVKGGIGERFAQLRRMGIRTVMITGDHPLTAAAIAAEAGVDDFMAQAKPEDKLRRIREEQAKGHLVAMTGDGANDAPALAQADVGVAMNTGTQAAREAGNMVDLDSNPTKLIEVVEVGKQLLMTRGALTTFSIANDVAKYFAILPAMFVGLYAAEGANHGPLIALNLMQLASPHSAILSAVIFNALILVALIPLALRGVAYRPAGAATVLRAHLLRYGLGGLVAPFVGIKAIDLALVFLRLA